MDAVPPCRPILSIHQSGSPVAVPPLTGLVRTAADWAADIRKLLERGKSSTLDLAKTLHLAKAELRYGEWSEMWTEHRLPFSKRKAEMLVVVGRQFGELDAQTFAHLPGGWSILYQLAQLRRANFMILIAERAIHPALTLAEAKGLVARFKGQAGGKNHRPNVKLRLHRFRDFVRGTSMDWNAAERDMVRAELCQLTQELKEPSGPLSSVSRFFHDCTSLAAGSPNN